MSRLNTGAASVALAAVVDFSGAVCSSRPPQPRTNNKNTPNTPPAKQWREGVVRLIACGTGASIIFSSRP